MLPNWENRPTIVANLLNPAFCGEVLRITMQSYEKQKKEAFPYPLAFIVLPILLHKNIRHSLPKTSTTKFYDWLEEDDSTRLYLPKKIKNLVPYTNESIRFLIYHNAIKFDESTNLIVSKHRKKKIEYSNNSEITLIFNKSKMFGKWLTSIGDVKTIYSLIGIKP